MCGNGPAITAVTPALPDASRGRWCFCYLVKMHLFFWILRLIFARCPEALGLSNPPE